MHYRSKWIISPNPFCSLHHPPWIFPTQAYLYHALSSYTIYLSLSLTFTYSYLKKFTYFVSHCLTGLDSTKQVNLLFIQHKQSSWIKTNKKEISSCTMIIGTSEKLLTSIIKQNWRQESIGVHVQNIQNFLIAYREPI